jgi:RimJ/RimL family protein N-acetyltransferase
VFRVLEGKEVNLRIVEKEDLALGLEWINNPEYFGEHQPLSQQSRDELERQYDRLTSDEKWFWVEKKNGKKIGTISYGPAGKAFDIGYNIIPSERRKKYGTEAVGIIVDFLFLSKDTVRIEARVDLRNVASQKVLEKSDFRKEGRIRKDLFIRGEWRDLFLYSILREEWKEPKILTEKNQE